MKTIPTPGPWEARLTQGQWTVTNPNAKRPRHPNWPGDGIEVCVCREAINGGGPGYGPRDLKTQDEAEADARLIAAAPDLLAALKKAERLLADMTGLNDTMLMDIRAAIAKAEGR